MAPENRNSATGNSHGETHDVGALRPNSYGVYDMTGNLWMWCNDRYDTASSNNYPSTPQIDQTGPRDRRPAHRQRRRVLE